jgi:hypothetical protein
MRGPRADPKFVAVHKNHLSSRFGIGLLSVTGAALVAAFVLAPAALLGRKVDLSGAVRRALVEFRQSGGPQLPTQLKNLVDYWFQWHAIKVVITLFMLTTFGLLAAALWQKYRRGAAGYAVAAVGASVLTGLASAVLILNVQATVVPLVALLGHGCGGRHGIDRSRPDQRIVVEATGHRRRPGLCSATGDQRRRGADGELAASRGGIQRVLGARARRRAARAARRGLRVPAT